MLERRGSVCTTAHDRWQSPELHSTGTGQTCQRPRNAAMVFVCFSLLSYSLFLAFSLLL